MSLLLYLFSLAINIYVVIIVIQVLVSWLITFEVINTSNEQAQNLIKLLRKATDPVYKPLQKYIPPIGGIDITPLVVILGLSLLHSIVIGAFYP
ncbi:MAG: YggT family protein [Alphaproteobacteria bacterium]|nr:YggT family protein [Alphaproteobacteria bacterium]